MIDARPRRFATLGPGRPRHTRPMLALPAPGGTVEHAPGADRLADLRFFAACYAAGLIFFLVMLS